MGDIEPSYLTKIAMKNAGMDISDPQWLEFRMCYEQWLNDKKRIVELEAALKDAQDAERIATSVIQSEVTAQADAYIKELQKTIDRLGGNDER